MTSAVEGEDGNIKVDNITDKFYEYERHRGEGIIKIRKLCGFNI